MESGLPRIFCGKGNSKSIYFKHFKRVRLRMRLFFFNQADVSRFPGDIQATLDFLYWCVTSEAGTSAMADKMGFVIPFKKAKDSTNPLITIANQYLADGKTSVDWCFSTMPSEEWKNGVGSALTAYAAGTGDWNGVVTAFVDGWAKEYKLANG